MLLKVEDLHTQFNTEEGSVRAVSGVSFTVDAGEVVGIVGESGCGKSVTSLSILRLIAEPGKITNGKILWDEGSGARDLVKLTEPEMEKLRGDRIAMIFQDPMTSLNPYLTIGEQLTEVLTVHRKTPLNEAKKSAIDMLGRVGIAAPHHRMDDYPHQLSGGMRQRVMIAMALLCEPALLIADEPTTALDVTIQAQILDLLRERKNAASGSGGLKMALLLITHDLGVVAEMADRVVVMYAGKVVEEAPTERLFAAPSHPYTQGLLKSIPRITGAREKRLLPIVGMPPSLLNAPSGCAFHPRCPHATDECQERVPELRTIWTIKSKNSESDQSVHKVRCHLETPPELTGREAA
ncbi:MAG: ABC transporter ATP-binding protein [Polyangiaceae bacterium]|nr:ABC transporter ATP-binding protein [Polyangiaceae bacterium]